MSSYYLPPSIKFSVVYPGLGGQEDSYLDLVISESSSSTFPTAGSTLDAWCIDRNAVIDPTPPAGTHYEGTLFSSSASELGLLAIAQPAFSAIFLANVDKLDSVNWLLNEYYRGTLTSTVAGVTASWQNMQGAIWSMLGFNGSATGSISGGSDTEINAIAGAALIAGDGYVADTDEYLSLIHISEPTRPY